MSLLDRVPDRRWLVAVSALLLVLTLLPLVAGFVATPPGQRFNGFSQEARDWMTYVADTEIGRGGDWLFRDPYTSEAQPSSAVYLPYIALGQLDRVLRLPPPVELHFVRILLAAGLLVSVYLLCVECFADSTGRRLAFVLTMLGGGLGFLSVQHGNIAGYRFVTLDIAVSGTLGLETLNVGIHVLLACLASVWLAILWIRHQRAPAWIRVAGGAGWVLVMSTAFPQMAGMWAIIGLVTWAAYPTRQGLPMAVAWALAAAPYAAYGLIERGRNPIFAGWSPLNDVDIGDPLSYLLWGHLLMLPFLASALFVVVRNWRKEPPSPLMILAIWLSVSAFLMYVPFLPTYHYRLYFGSFVPFGVLTASGLTAWVAAARSPRSRRRRLIYPATIMCAVGLQTAAEGVSIPLLHRDDLAVYVPTELAASLESLRDRGGSAREVVVSSYLSGLDVPVYGRKTAYLGDPTLTLDLARKAGAVRDLYLETDAATMRRRALELGAEYVLWGPYERWFGGPDPGRLAGWEVVARSGATRVYRVSTR